MRLSEWAKKNNVSYRTAKRWFDAGKIDGAYRISERIILVPDTTPTTPNTSQTAAIYARVSSHDQKEDLNRQAQRLEEYATAQGYTITHVAKEIASGMNPRRKKLITLLTDPAITTIIVENRDRLARMNADLIIAATDKNIIIINETEPETNDIQDIIDFLTSVCARQYGRRSAKNRAERQARTMLNDKG